MTGVFVVGSSLSASAAENDSLTEVEKKLKYLEEEYSVELTVSESDSFSVQSENSSAQSFEEFEKELKLQAELINALADQDNWIEQETSINNDFGIMADLSGTAVQTSAFDVSTLNDDWSSNQEVPFVDRNISFYYEAETSSVSGGLPSFTSISSESSYISGVEPNLDWNQESIGSTINGTGSEVSLSATGTWSTSATWNGIDGELSTRATWDFAYASSRLN